MTTDNQSLKIFRPELQTNTQRTLMAILGAACWIIWVYIWLPLITCVLWLFSVHEIHEKIFLDSKVVHFEFVPWIIMYSVCMIVAWSSYNRFQSLGRVRRPPAAALSREAKMESFGVQDPAFIQTLEERRMSFEFYRTGAIARIEGFASVESAPFLAEGGAVGDKAFTEADAAELKEHWSSPVDKQPS